MYDEYSAKIGTKIGGYPSWTQSSNYPKCKCGKVEEFLFQLSSEDSQNKKETATNKEWSPHGIMIGDLGNNYYFVCKSCGTHTIESNWIVPRMKYQ